MRARVVELPLPDWNPFVTQSRSTEARSGLVRILPAGRRAERVVSQPHMIQLLLILALGAEAQPIRVAVPGLTAVNLEPGRADAYTTHLAQQLTFRGVRAVTSSDLAAVLGLERQQQLLGCADDGCRGTVVLNANFDGLLSGTVSKLGSKWTLDVRVLEPGSAHALATASVSSGDEDGLVASLALVAEQLAAQLSTALQRPLVPQLATELRRASAVKRLSWLPLAVGVAAGGAGAAGLVLANGAAGQLKLRRDTALAPGQAGGPLTTAQSDQLVREGQLQQTLGWVGVGVGAAGLVTAAAMFLFGGDEVVTANISLSPGQLSVGVAGTW